MFNFVHKIYYSPTKTAGHKCQKGSSHHLLNYQKVRYWRAEGRYIEGLVNYERENLVRLSPGCWYLLTNCFLFREDFELFNDACSRALQCGGELCFDESLYANRGRNFSFKQYLPQKPARYGFLFRSLGDAVHAYIYRLGWSDYVCVCTNPRFQILIVSMRIRIWIQTESLSGPRLNFMWIK